MKKGEQSIANQQRSDKQQERTQKVYFLQPESWREEVKQYEKDFAQFVAENPDMSNHLEKWWENMRIIKIHSIAPLLFSIKDVYGCERNQQKWDALQELRCRRKFANGQEQQALETIPEENLDYRAEEDGGIVVQDIPF